MTECREGDVKNREKWRFRPRWPTPNSWEEGEEEEEDGNE